MGLARSFFVSVVVVAAFVGGCGPSRPAGAPVAITPQVSPWEGTPGGRRLDTRHYRIFTTTSNPMLLSTMPGYMEAAYAQYVRTTGLGELPAGEPMCIYLMGTREEWEKLTAKVVGARSGITSIEAGGYCYQKVCVFWDMGGLGTLSTASHEGLHQFLAYRMKHGLPMWLEEGLCATAEGHEFREGCVTFTPGRNAPRHNNLRAALMRDRWIPTQALLSMDAGDLLGKPTEVAVGYYGQLWALALFLQTPAHNTSFQRLLGDAAAGRLHQAMGEPGKPMTPDAFARLQASGRAYNRTIGEPVFRHYIAQDVEAFDREYKAFARRLVGMK